MTEQEAQDILLIGKFMGIKNLFPYQPNGFRIIGIYIGEDEDGTINYEYVGVLIEDLHDIVDSGINWYAPHMDWNTLMDVCKKIIEMYFDNRTDIFEGLNKCDKTLTFKACLKFIKFWNDDTQEKINFKKK